MQFNIAKAVECYYGQLEIGTSDIQEIYGCGKNKAVELKKKVQEINELLDLESEDPVVQNVRQIAVDILEEL